MFVDAAEPREVEQQDGMIARFLLGTALFDQFLEPGAIGQAGQAVGNEFAAQIALGHHFLRPVDQGQQEQRLPPLSSDSGPIDPRRSRAAGPSPRRQENS